MGPSAPGVRLRQAEASDLPALRALYDEFHAFHARGVPDRLIVPLDRSEDRRLERAISTILDRQDAMLVVAEADGVVVGLAELELRHREATPFTPERRYGHLQSLAVTERLRRAGIGALLLAAAERWVVERGATELETDIWEFGDGPLGFYERAGYATRRRTLARCLVPGAPVAEGG